MTTEQSDIPLDLTAIEAALGRMVYRAGNLEAAVRYVGGRLAITSLHSTCTCPTLGSRSPVLGPAERGSWCTASPQSGVWPHGSAAVTLI
ncbi:hypothetical protein RKD30_005338 [Streptomyces pristinaespiralis]